jgi:hypothetical protein
MPEPPFPLNPPEPRAQWQHGGTQNLTRAMKTIHLDFCQIPATMPKTDNFFYNLLRKRFDVQLVDRPDFLIYSDHGRHRQRLYTCTKIYYTYECYQPDFDECDYALTCNYLADPRHFRLPIYVHYCGGRAGDIVKRHDDWRRMLAGKTKFCALLTSNVHSPGSLTRTRFFHELSKYKRVDSGGGALNNLGHVVPWGGKIEFLRPYKFNLAFENESRIGYTTEKLFDAMLARCVPIYWGNPRVAEEFDPRSFVNYHDFPSEKAFVERIIELDKDEARYAEFLRRPFFYDDVPSPHFDEERLLDFFEQVFARAIRPVSRRRHFFFGRWLLVKKDAFPAP